MEKGIEIGKRKAFETVEEVVIELMDEPGIGPVTQDKIIAALGKIPRKIDITNSDL